jgi:hypothetical protein
MLACEVAEEDPEHPNMTSQEIAEWRVVKRQLVVTTALRAVSKLLAQQPSFDLETLSEAVRSVTQRDDLDPSILREAQQSLKRFGELTSAIE